MGCGGSRFKGFKLGSRRDEDTEAEAADTEL